MIVDPDPLDFNPTGEKWYQVKLLRHPRCDDPDHPGCDKCQGLEYDEEWLDD